MIVDTSLAVKQEVFAALVGIGQPAVSHLLSRATLTPGAPLGTWLNEYTAHLMEAAQARGGGAELATERAALAKAQRERIEMQNAVTRGELAPTAQLEHILAATAAKVSGIFAAIPDRVRYRLPQIEAEALELIAEEVGKICSVVGAMNLADPMPADDIDAVRGGDADTHRDATDTARWHETGDVA